MNISFIRVALINLLLLITFSINISAQSEWTRTSNPPWGSISAIVTINDNIFAGASSGGVYFSDDNGVSWIQRNGEFPNMSVSSLVVNGTDIYAGTVGGDGARVYQSSNNGLNWIDITPAAIINSIYVSAMVVDSDNIYIGIGDEGIFKSALNGISALSWSSFSFGLVNLGVRSLKINGTTIYAGTYGDGVWVSPTNNASWSLTSSTMPANSDYIQAIEISGSNIFAGNISGLPVLFQSNDNGATWIQSSTSIFNDEAVYAIYKDSNNNVYVGTEGAGMFFSSDEGVTWSEFNGGFRDGSGNWFCNQINIRSIVFTETHIYAGSDCGVWIRSIPSLGLNELSQNDSFIFYPNPNNGKFIIEINPIDKINIEIFNSLGQKILSKIGLTKQSNEINLTNSSKGIYFVKIFNGSKVQTKKFVIQ